MHITDSYVRLSGSVERQIEHGQVQADWHASECRKAREQGRHTLAAQHEIIYDGWLERIADLRRGVAA